LDGSDSFADMPVLLEFRPGKVELWRTSGFQAAQSIDMRTRNQFLAMLAEAGLKETTVRVKRSRRTVIGAIFAVVPSVANWPSRPEVS
jgi:hypothetical protein